MQRAIGDLGNVGFFHVLAANARKYFAVNLHLAVGAIVGRGVDASHRSDNDEEKNSKRTDEISKLLFDTYKKNIRFPRDSSFQVNFSRPSTYVVFDTAKNKKKTPFAKAVYEPTLMLALLNEKNVDLNSLSRMRKYFVESYFKSGTYEKYPNVLFDFQYRVLKAGHWDAYSHWILFKGDEAAGNQWVNANRAKWDNFTKWYLKNKLLLDKNYKFYSSQYD